MAIACFSKKFSLISIAALVVGAVALWFVWFGTSSLISKEVVEANLQNFSGQLADFGNAHGKDIKLSYGEVTIEGWGYSKKAVVNAVNIESSSKSNPNSRMTVSTDKFTVESDPMNPNRVIFSFVDPINYSEAGQAGKTIAFSEPLKYAYTQSGSSSQGNLFLPAQIVISGGSSADVEGDKITIGFASQPTLEFKSSPEQKFRSLIYNFSGVTLTGSDGSKASISSIVSDFNEAQEGETKIAGKFNFSATDIIVGDAVKTSKPYSLVADFAFSGDDENVPQPVAPPSIQGADESNVSVQSSKNETIINQVVFSGADFKLRASGNVTRSSEDPLPSGAVSVDVDNLQQFITSEVVPVEVRGSVEAALEKITGQSIVGKDSVSIPLKRQKNGVFYVGNTTFEALFASVVSDVMMQRPASSVGVVPATAITPENGALEGRLPEDVAVPATVVEPKVLAPVIEAK